MSSEGTVAEERVSVVAEGTLFKGALQAQGPVEVHGSLDGEVHAPALKIGAEGQVRGDINVSALRSEGVIAGQVIAETVALAGAIADGTVVNAQVLSAMGDGGPEDGLLLGSCVLEVGPNPSELHDFLAGMDQAPAADGAAGGGKGKEKPAKEAAAEAPAE